jgi:hypothetical protein
MRRTYPCSPPSVFSPEPDRAPPIEFAHNDTVRLALSDRDLVNANDLGPGLTSALDLLAHVLRLERLDRSPIEQVFLRHILDRGRSTASTDVESKALGVEWVVSQPVELLSLHPLAVPALDPADSDLKVDTHASGGKIPDPAQFVIIPPTSDPTTNCASRFFERRVRPITRACGSPNRPVTVRAGWNPGKR